MQAYDAYRFDPPAPLALVTVRSEELGVVVVLLDTGADVSLLPRSRVSPLEAPDATRYELEAFDGTRTTGAGRYRCAAVPREVIRGQFLLNDS